MSNESAPLDVSIDPQQLLDVFVAQMASITNCATLSLRGISLLLDETEPQFTPGVEMSVAFGPEVVSSRDSRALAVTWITGSAFRDSANALALLAEHLWRYILLIQRSDNGQLRIPAGTQLHSPNLPQMVFIANQLYGNDATCIDKPGLRGKLELFNKQFGVALTLISELESINDVRNCLTHRLGLVTERDVNDPAASALTVKYRHHAVLIRDAKGLTMPLRPRMTVQPDSSIVVGRQYSQRRFPLGSRVMLSAQEFMDVLATLRDSGIELVHLSRVAMQTFLNSAARTS